MIRRRYEWLQQGSVLGTICFLVILVVITPLANELQYSSDSSESYSFRCYTETLPPKQTICMERNQQCHRNHLWHDHTFHSRRCSQLPFTIPLQQLRDSTGGSSYMGMSPPTASNRVKHSFQWRGISPPAVLCDLHPSRHLLTTAISSLISFELTALLFHGNCIRYHNWSSCYFVWENAEDVGG